MNFITPNMPRKQLMIKGKGMEKGDLVLIVSNDSANPRNTEVTRALLGRLLVFRREPKKRAYFDLKFYNHTRAS